MTNLDIQETGREGELLIRSCRVKINGNTIVTPTRTIGVSLSAATELQEAKRFIGNKFKPFGEVFVRIKLNDIDEYIIDAGKREKFNAKLSRRVGQLKDAGALPYVLLSILDNNGYPLNRLLPPNELEFIFNVLWGIPGNSIITTPLLGTLESPDEHGKLIEAFFKRQTDSIDRKNQPLMAIIPSSYYALNEPKLIEKYWECGVRIFGYNCENKKYGAYSIAIDSLHNLLSQLSKKSEEEYILNAINSKYKYGKANTSRINNLIGAGFGFDTYSPNHISPKFIVFSEKGDSPRRYVFNEKDYGFIDTKELNNMKNIDDLIDTNAFKNIDLSELNTLGDYQLKKLCTSHDIEKTIKEISNYSAYIENNELIKHLSSKAKIVAERAEIEGINRHQSKSTDEEWFSK